MANLRFKAADLKRVIDFTLTQELFGVPYENKTTTTKGLYLVGDRGVYLMSAAVERDLVFGDPQGSIYVVYAEGINPKVDEFDAWWDKKQKIFGGDDGVEFLDWVPQIKAMIDANKEWIVLKLTREGIELIN